MKIVLIIGSDSYIAQQFISSYKDVFNFICISRKNTGSTKELIIEDFSLIPAELFDKVDVVFNFAAIVHRKDIKNDLIYFSINYELAILNAHKAKSAGVKLFVQMSTIAVYGNHTHIKIDSQLKPIDFYGRSKLAADKALIDLSDESFHIAIIRPPMVYGGGLAPGNMLRLIKLVDFGFSFSFKRISDNKRDFINIMNLVQYLYLTGQNELSGVFIVSDNEPVSTKSLLRLIEIHLNKGRYIIRIPSFFLRFLRVVRPLTYNKLFGDLCLESNFPYENLIHKFSLENGIIDMVNEYKKIR